MSNPTIIECVVSFHDIRDRTVQSTTLQVTLGPKEDFEGLLAAMKAGEKLTISASALHFYDRNHTFAGREAPQYRPVREFKP